MFTHAGYEGFFFESPGGHREQVRLFATASLTLFTTELRYVCFQQKFLPKLAMQLPPSNCLWPSPLGEHQDGNPAAQHKYHEDIDPAPDAINALCKAISSLPGKLASYYRLSECDENH